MTYISSASMSNPMRQSIMQIQSDLTRATTESSSGKKADIGLSLGASTGNALSLQSEIDQLNSFTATNTLATARLSSTSNVLTSMVTAAQNMSQTLVQATGVGASSTLQTSAQNALQGLVGSLNTTTGGQFIFGGIQTAAQPLAATAPTDFQTSANAAFQTYLTANGTTAATITGLQMQSFLDNQFSALFSNANWTTNVSTASNTTIQTNISPSQSLNTSVSANDGSIRQVAQAYTMLGAFAGQGLSSDAATALTATAGKLISSGIAGLNNVTAGIGVAQATMDTASTQISSQTDVLKSNVSDLEEVDPEILATKISSLTTQLNASYELTSKIAQLSLVNYLNG